MMWVLFSRMLQALLWKREMFVFLIIVFLNTGCQGGQMELKLINDIFKTRNHNMYGRPVKNEALALEVQFGIALQQIIDVDEKNEMLKTNLWLNYEWMDYNLGWNKEQYGGIDSIRLPSSLIWTPDILLYNTAHENVDTKYPTNVIVYHDGKCIWLPLGLYTSSCAIDIQWFPFDDQLCTLKFGSWTYDGGSINLTAKADSVDMSTFAESGEWKIVDTPAVRSVLKYDCCPEPYIDITYTIHLRRRTLYYGFNMIIPCALISVLALLTFVLPPDAGEKIGLGITILLALSVAQLMVAEIVPTTSLHVPLIGLYFSSAMIMCTISVTMTVLVLNYHHRNPDMYEMSPVIRKVVCDWIAWLLRMKRPGKTPSQKFMLHRAAVNGLESGLTSTPLTAALNLSNFVKRGTVVENGTTFNDYQFGGSPDSEEDITAVKNELHTILSEVCFITKKIKEDAEGAQETNDWKFAAMVIDRLCLWVFTAYLVIATFAIFSMAPHIL